MDKSSLLEILLGAYSLRNQYFLSARLIGIFLAIEFWDFFFIFHERCLLFFSLVQLLSSVAISSAATGKCIFSSNFLNYCAWIHVQFAILLIVNSSCQHPHILLIVFLILTTWSLNWNKFNWLALLLDSSILFNRLSLTR